MKVLDEARVAELWQAIKEHTDQTGGGSSGPVKWEDIDGRPDLSEVSSVITMKVTLSHELWDDENQLVAIVPGVVKDIYSQVVTVVPVKESKQAYQDAGITCEDQGENSLTFHANNIPENDIVLAVAINESVETREIPVGDFDWWSPHMTSDTEPAPYVASASSYIEDSDLEPFRAFDGLLNTAFASDNTVDGGVSPWIQFDFGEKVYISGIRMKADVAGSAAKMPKIFSINGSNDGKSWNPVYQSTGDEYSTGSATKWNEYSFSPMHYRYYRLVCTKTYSSVSYVQIVIGELEFLKQKEAE